MEYYLNYFLLFYHFQQIYQFYLMRKIIKKFTEEMSKTKQLLESFFFVRKINSDDSSQE